MNCPIPTQPVVPPPGQQYLAQVKGEDFEVSVQQTDTLAVNVDISSSKEGTVPVKFGLSTAAQQALLLTLASSLASRVGSQYVLDLLESNVRDHDGEAWK